MVGAEDTVLCGSAEVFEASATYTGARPGFCFKLGLDGLGYYLDVRDEDLESEFHKEANSLDPGARSAILKLAWRGRFDVLPHMLVKAPRLWNATFQDGTTLLHFAARKCAIDFLHLALTEGNLDVDAVDKQGRTPFMWAVGFGHLSAMRSLLKANANPMRRDRSGGSALIIAAQNGQHSAMLLLLAVSSDKRNDVLGALDLKGRNAAHWAALRGDLVSLKLLSRFHANLQQVDGLQNTMLHLAVQAERIGNSKDIFAFLIKHGVDPCQENASGLTCMDIAKDSMNPDVLPSLDKALARKAGTATKTKKNDVIDLEVGFSEKDGNTVQKMWRYMEMAVWVSCVSFTILEYMIDVRQLAWDSWWLRWAAFMFECCLLISLALFIYIATSNPGIVPSNIQNGPESFLRLLRSGADIPATRLCTTTWILKDLRTEYCEEMGVCIQEFDQYCDFTACAIGKRNHRAFVVFVAVELAAHCWYLFLCAVTVLYTQGVPSLWGAPMWAFWSAWQNPLMVMGAAIHCCALPLVVYEGTIQCYLIYTNTTHNEFHNWPRYEHLWVDSEPHRYMNAFNKGESDKPEYINCLDFWWLRRRAEVGPQCRSQVKDLAAALKDAGAK